MKQRPTQGKKRTIFRMFLRPLIMLMLLQGLLTMGTLISRRTFGTVRDYSVNMMSRTVENRKVILENEMTQRWASVGEQRNDINALLKKFLLEKGITIGRLSASGELQYEFLERAFPECLEIVQNDLTTGIFLVFTGENRQEASDYRGFFIRDYDPLVRTVSYKDMLLERGNKKLSRISGIPLDTCWTTDFRMEGEGRREADRFFYEPWRARRIRMQKWWIWATGRRPLFWRMTTRTPMK